MKRSRDEFLPGARLSLNHDCRVCPRDSLDQRESSFHGLGAAHQTWQRSGWRLREWFGELAQLHANGNGSEGESDVWVIHESFSDREPVEESAVGGAQILHHGAAAFDKETAVGAAHRAVSHVDIVLLARAQGDVLVLEFLDVLPRLIAPREPDTSHGERLSGRFARQSVCA